MSTGQIPAVPSPALPPLTTDETLAILGGHRVGDAPEPKPSLHINPLTIPSPAFPSIMRAALNSGWTPAFTQSQFSDPRTDGGLAYNPAPLPFNKIAAAMARLGIPIVPLAAKGKNPILPGWQDRATTHPQTLIDWTWQYGKDCNAGCVATPDGVWILDLDNPQMLARIEQETGQKIPRTYSVASRKGVHLYFKQTDASRKMGNRACHAVPYEFDAQVDRRQVVAPGSTHPSGFVYHVIDGYPIVEAPEWLIQWVIAHSEPEKKSTPTSDYPSVHEDFDFDDFCGHYGISGSQDGDWFICDECPVAGYRHEQSTRTGFFYDGEHLGFHCFAQGCDGNSMTIGDVLRHLSADHGHYPEPIWEEDETLLDGMDMDDAEELELENGNHSNGEAVAMGPGTDLEPGDYDFMSGEPIDEPVPDPTQEQVEQVCSAIEKQAEAEQETSFTPEPGPAKKKTLKVIGERTVEDTGTWQFVARSMADIEMESLKWLWPNRIPSGKTTLFTGKPDCGKSLTLLDLCARISTGADFPDGERNPMGARKVLIAASEDDPADTLAPRLKAAGANPDNILIVRCVAFHASKEDKAGKRKKVQELALNLKRDAEMLTNTIKDNPDIALVVFDPLTSYFGDADQNKDKDIRPIMDSLAKLCQKSGITIIGLVHSNKRSDVDATAQVSGAGSLAASVRAVWRFARDAEDKTKFRMALVKGNLSRKRSGLAYSIEEVQVPIRGEMVGVPRIVWGAEIEEDANDLLNQERQKAREGGTDTKLIQAKTWLQCQSLPIKARTMYEQGEAAGISPDTMKRACRVMGMESIKKNDGWYWYPAGTKDRMAKAKMAEAGEIDRGNRDLSDLD